MLTGSLLAMATISVQTALLLSGMVAPWSLFVPGFFLTFSQGIALPYAQVGAMSVIPPLAGTAAGVGVFTQNMGGAVLTQLYGLLADGTPLPMIAIVSASAVLCLAAGVLAFLHGPIRPIIKTDGEFTTTCGRKNNMVATVNAGARLDRLPISSFHYRIFWLIGAGMFFDGYDLYVGATVLGAAVQTNSRRSLRSRNSSR